MLIQVLGLREYVDKRTNKTKKTDRFFQEGWRLDSIQDVFGPKGLEIVNKIPEVERYNIYFTMAHCYEDAKRKMAEMRTICFDIDNITYNENYKTTCMQVATAVASVVKVPVTSLGVIFSGHGVQVFVNMDTPITDVAYFDKYKKHYGVLCDLISLRLNEMGVAGELDPTVFDDARIMRMPNTLNKKKDKAVRMAEIVQGTILPVPWDIVTLAGIGDATYEVITDEVLKNYPTPDSPAVIAECGFIQHCKNKPALVKEYEWYAMVSITSRLEDGELLTHRLSEGHPQYNTYETDAKIKQALASAGPRTCSNIATMFDGCKQCPHWQKIKSPIQIKGPEYIASKDFGFRERKVDKRGNLKPGLPAYDDIIKEFQLSRNYRVLADTKQFIIFNGTHWEELELQRVKEWVSSIIHPSASKAEIEETVYRMQCKSVVNRSEFAGTARGMLNFKNVVYDIINNKTMTHGPEYGFFNVIPYDYDPRATCPLWDQFLDQIMLGRERLVTRLMRFAGYCLAYDSYWIQKCLILYGSGSNGKSVFMETLGKVIGDDNVSKLPLNEIINDKQARLQLVHKFFNFSDESSKHVFKESSMFKTLTQGGSMNVKKLYAQEYTVENKAKFIISFNEMPETGDFTPAFYRRLSIIPFDFKVEPGDAAYIPDLKERIWATELPGICNKMIAQYRDLLANPVWEDADESKVLLNQYRESADVVQMYRNDWVEVTNVETDEVTNDQMYEMYKRYSDVNGYRQITSAAFFKRLGKVLSNDPVVAFRNGKSIRVRKGIKIIEKGM
jgi:putative DNA primase/helicase